MRLFEIMLLSSNVLLLILLFLPRTALRRQAMLPVSGTAAAILLIHFIVEGGRWQLLVPYLMTPAFLAVAIIRLVRGASDRKSRVSAWITLPLKSLLALALLASASLAVLLPVFSLPEPAGPYAIGTRIFHWVDTNREETIGADGGKREIMVQLWYPAKHDPKTETAPLVPEGMEILNAVAAEMQLPGQLISQWQYVLTHSSLNAELSGEQPSYPLILLSHGMGTARFLQTSQAENLASHGYIVASVEHPYSTLASVFPDGRVTHNETDTARMAKSADFRDEIGSVWTEDMRFALDQLEKMNSGQAESGFTGRIDMSRVGVMGHSYGGGASYDIMPDDRVDAGIGMDGTLYGFRGEAAVTKPFLFFYAEDTFNAYNEIRKGKSYTDAEIERMGTTREQLNEQLKLAELEIQQISQTLKSGNQLLYLDCSSHYNFTDLQLASPLLPQLGFTGSIGGKRSTAIVNQVVLEFFNEHLLGRSSGLPEKPDSSYPELRNGTSEFAEGLQETNRLPKE
ncbi:alpha/beta hydrolase family protein [Paenibacillus tarimensis]|uniref:alpha/beta hydrolase family protein n=1 Tax=Paenibacillus tarimensis TaxID=416012 RepID=UPI001F460C56|nr:dienelactone hydrolase [Paenibacillus tarimensis]MCF2945259.1 dienelactone hydrolase [Paenibacillus tarimensis]